MSQKIHQDKNKYRPRFLKINKEKAILGLKGIWNKLGIYKIKGLYMKTLNTYHILWRTLSSKDPSLKDEITSQNSIHPMVRGYKKIYSSPVKNVSFKRTWYSVGSMQYLYVFKKNIFSILLKISVCVALSPNQDQQILTDHNNNNQEKPRSTKISQ